MCRMRITPTPIDSTGDLAGTIAQMPVILHQKIPLAVPKEKRIFRGAIP
jgi:hypothetical protein